MTLEIKWMSEPEDHDYPAAQSYLELIMNPLDVQFIIKDLRSADMTRYKAKDIFRASKLPLLGIGNSHIEKNKKKIEHGKYLSPLLLVRDVTNRKLIIADGYHRMCAVYLYDEDAWIECKIVSM